MLAGADVQDYWPRHFRLQVATEGLFGAAGLILSGFDYRPGRCVRGCLAFLERNLRKGLIRNGLEAGCRVPGSPAPRPSPKCKANRIGISDAVFSFSVRSSRAPRGGTRREPHSGRRRELRGRYGLESPACAVAPKCAREGARRDPSRVVAGALRRATSRASRCAVLRRAAAGTASGSARSGRLRRSRQAAA